MILYRPLLADDDAEEEAALKLWVANFSVPSEQVIHEYRADPSRRARTFVAVSPEGAIASAVAYSPRDLRDVDGRPVRVGGVSAVATRPDARGQGHARKLLEMAVESMRREDCAWSLLFTDVPGYYERLGWQTIETRYREGLLASPPADGVDDYSVKRYDPAQVAGGWEALAEVYDAYNASRPLCLVRSVSYWRDFLAPKLTAPTALLLVARVPDGEAIDGYLLAHMLEGALIVTEIGLRPGRAGVATALLGHLLTEAATRGIDRGRAYLPFELEIDAALGQAFVGLRTGYHQAMMALPIDADFGFDRIRAIFAAPSAIYWPSDDF